MPKVSINKLSKEDMTIVAKRLQSVRNLVEERKGKFAKFYALFCDVHCEKFLCRAIGTAKGKKGRVSLLAHDAITLSHVLQFDGVPADPYTRVLISRIVEHINKYVEHAY